MKKFIVYTLIAGMLLSFFPREVFATDWANPNFSSQKFILTRADNKVEILHKYAFGNEPAQRNYDIQNEEKFHFADLMNTPLNNKFTDKYFKIFHPQRADFDSSNDPMNTNPINLDMIAVENGNQFIMAGIFATEYQEPQYNCILGNNILGFGYVYSGKKISKKVCLFDPQEFKTDSNSNKYIWDNYVQYVYQLNSFLGSHTIGTISGSGSVVMTPEGDKIDKCKDGNGDDGKSLKGPINANYPEYYNTFVDSILQEVKPDYQKDLRELFRRDDVKVSESEDVALWKSFYATDPNLAYANKYMDEAMYGDLIGIADQIGIDNSLKRLYDDKLWFEKFWAKAAGETALGITGATGAVAGGAYAYSLGASAAVAWINSLAVIPTPLFHVGNALLSSGSAASGLAAAIAPVLVIAIIGVILTLGILALYYNEKADVNRQWAHDGLRLLYAMTYIEANKQSQECTGLWAKYPEQEETFSKLMSLATAALKETQDAAANGANPSDECEAIKVKGISGYIRKAFCSLGLILQAFSDDVLADAFLKLKNSLGYFNG